MTFHQADNFALGDVPFLALNDFNNLRERRSSRFENQEPHFTV